jgi:hypothetical protein
VLELSKAFVLVVPHDSALEIRDEVGFFQEVRAVLAMSISEGGGKSPEELELAVRQIVSRAISSDKVIDSRITVWQVQCDEGKSGGSGRRRMHRVPRLQRAGFHRSRLWLLDVNATQNQKAATCSTQPAGDG